MVHATVTDRSPTSNAISVDPIPDDAYEKLAFVFERRFSEIEEDLLHISLAALSLDRGSVTDGCAILRDKLCFFAEETLLQDHQLDRFYEFMQHVMAEEEETDLEEVVYSPLEDKAYEEIFVDVLEDIRDITTDARYMHYPPIRTQIDALQEPLDSLGLALEDAEKKRRQREIYDKREILTKKAFEVPNSRNYTQDKVEGQSSFYDRLLEIQKTVQDIREQMNLATYDVGLSLTKSAYLLAQAHANQYPELDRISNQLIDLMGTETEDDYKIFEQRFVERLAQVGAEIHGVISNNLSKRLAKITADLENAWTTDGQYDENNWASDYVTFVHRAVVDFNNQTREFAFQRYDQIAAQIDYQHQLIETFVSGISVPALLPAQLHESGNGLQTFLVQQLQNYLNMQNLQLHTVPGRENQLRSLISELMPERLESPLEQLEYFFMTTA